MTSYSSALFAAALALSAILPAQTPPISYYVGNPQPNIPGGGNFTTLRAAIEAALGSPFPVVINVAPGTYVETTEISLPAHGVHIEAWSGNDKPVIRARFVIDRVENSSLPPTTLENLVIEADTDVEQLSGQPVIAIQVPPTAATLGVVIRNCDFLFLDDEAAPYGVEIQTRAGHIARHVIEGNRFEFVGDKNDTVGIRETCAGRSSTLIRSNLFENLETSIECFSNAGIPAIDFRPRVVSNGMQRGERHVDMGGCAPAVFNNTLGDFKYHGPEPILFPITVFGIRFSACEDVRFDNNIVWFQVPSDPAFNDIGDVVGIAVSSSNYLDDAQPPGTASPLLPNDFPRLDPASGLAASGIVTAIQPGESFMDSAGEILPTDVPVDFEGDMRIVQGPPPGDSLAVAIGCDQPAPHKADILPGPGIDSFGSLYFTPAPGPNPTTCSSQPFTVRTSGLEAGWVFVLTITRVSDAVTQHTTHPVFGSYTTEPGLPIWTSPATVVGANGEVDITVPSATLPLFLPFIFEQESNNFVQGIAIAPDFSQGVITNRIRTEVDWDPTP